MSAPELEEATTAEAAAEEAVKMNLEVKVDKPSACQRHVTVAVSREDIERYFKQAFDELVPKAELPGFRAGRAPRKLVEKSFREQVTDQVKGKLVMESMTQISDEQQFSAISEPDFDYNSITLPDEGPLRYEFKIEVRPEFDLPAWQGMKLERPVHTYSEEEVDAYLKKLLARYSKVVDSDEPVQVGDLLNVDLTFTHEGKQVAHKHEHGVVVTPVLNFSDAKLEGFDKLMEGKKTGDTVETKIKISADADSDELRGQEIDLSIKIEAVQKYEYPELNEGFLDRIGGFADEAELRTEVRKQLEKQLGYNQRQRVRQQITSLLTVAANWDLPPELLRRQARRELERAAMELQSHGFSQEQIRSHANELQQNIMAYTARSLKEHFILERIAEDQKIDAEPDDFNKEIELLAEQNDESPRRVRARIEKQGAMDTLRNQIIERKVIDLIESQAKFEEVPHVPAKTDSTAIDFAIAGSLDRIAEAKYGNETPTPGMPQLKKENKD
ncbi:Trigger factor [Anatilimnocola aggregata]|uniref:Trigger factor n=1 Tax=Anatilimnocola aggregata TaxID=2528021 RepID=A0A517YJL0_9BACT|nr:trigger factor [Anatilimnocola aggregata]QDU30397.1 Trigger factor [Anatilimnocola aggregata]